MDRCGGRPAPPWEGGNIVSEGGAVDFVNKDAEEGGGLVTRVGPQFRADVDDEGRSHSREQTGLTP